MSPAHLLYYGVSAVCALLVFADVRRIGNYLDPVRVTGRGADISPIGWSLLTLVMPWLFGPIYLINRRQYRTLVAADLNIDELKVRPGSVQAEWISWDDAAAALQRSDGDWLQRSGVLAPVRRLEDGRWGTTTSAVAREQQFQATAGKLQRLRRRVAVMLNQF